MAKSKKTYSPFGIGLFGFVKSYAASPEAVFNYQITNRPTSREAGQRANQSNLYLNRLLRQAPNEEQIKLQGIK